jgi:hypothetical protein
LLKYLLHLRVVTAPGPRGPRRPCGADSARGAATSRIAGVLAELGGPTRQAYIAGRSSLPLEEQPAGGGGSRQRRARRCRGSRSGSRRRLPRRTNSATGFRNTSTGNAGRGACYPADAGGDALAFSLSG